MPVWLRLLLLSCLAISVASPIAYAQSDEDKLEAQKLIAKGSKLLAKGDALMGRQKAEKALNSYEGALEAYEQAYEAYSSPQIFLLIAIAEQKLGRYLEAMRHYETMLSDSSSDKLKKEAADAAIAGMKDVQEHLSAIDITVEQDGATVRVDGEKIGVTPLDGPYWLDPGKHTYTVTLKGHTPKEEVLDLDVQETASRQLRLLALPISVKPKKITDDEEPLGSKPSAKTPSKATLYASFGVSGVLLAGSLATGLTASKRHDTFSNALTDEERESARKSGKNLSLAADLMLAGGLLAAGYGVFSYYTSYKPEKERLASETALWITPYMSGNETGIALGASF